MSKRKKVKRINIYSSFKKLGFERKGRIAGRRYRLKKILFCFTASFKETIEKER